MQLGLRKLAGHAGQKTWPLNSSASPINRNLVKTERNRVRRSTTSLTSSGRDRTTASKRQWNGMSIQTFVIQSRKVWPAYPFRHTVYLRTVLGRNGLEYLVSERTTKQRRSTANEHIPAVELNHVRTSETETTATSSELGIEEKTKDQELERQSFSGL